MMVGMDDLDAIVWEADARTRSFTHVSDASRELLDLEPADWLADPGFWPHHIHEDDRDRILAAFARTADAAERLDEDLRMVDGDGDPVWMRMLGHAVPGDDGLPTLVRGLMVEITAHKRTEQEGMLAARRFRTLVEALPAIVYSEDFVGHRLQIAFVNRRAEEILGISPEQWVATPGIWLDSIHEDDRDRVRAEEERTNRTGEPFSVEYRMRTQDGRELWFRDEAALVHDEDDLSYWQGVMVDITDLKSAQAQAAEAEARFRALVEQTPAITYVDDVDALRSTLYISPQTTTVLGYTPEDWYEDPMLWSKIVHTGDLERLAGSEEPGPSVYRLLARDGHEVWVHDEARLITDDEGMPMFWQGVLVDVTGQKRAEALTSDLESERLVSKSLREADDLKNTFLQALAHDLRSPLAAVMGLAATLERPDLDLSPLEQRDFAARITENSKRLERIVNDMLDLERMNRGILRPRFEPLDVGGLVRDVVGRSTLVVERRLQLDTAPLQIEGDRAMIERIVENLLTNTGRHTPGDSRIWVRVERTREGALLMVEDDGPGVPEAERDTVFEAFRQGTSAGHGAGVGVGLALVARFVAAHGGRAWVEDRAGGGASFRVTLASVPGESEEPAGAEDDLIVVDPETSS